MSQFAVQSGASGGELLIGGMPLTQLAARVGQTPFFAFDRELLKARVAELRVALPRGIELHYAMKANPMPRPCRARWPGWWTASTWRPQAS